MRTKAAITAGVVIIIPIIWYLSSCEREKPAPTVEVTAAGRTFASNGSPGSIQSIHDTQAADGDTITLPTGNFNWTTNVRITKAITIKGNTTTDTTNGTASDNTVITDNSTNRNDALFFFLTSNGGHGGQRVTGITVKGGSTQQNYGGIIQIRGHDPSRVDHCHFINVFGAPQIYVTEANFGVADHNVCELAGLNGQPQPGFVHCWMKDYGGKTNGDGAWEEPAGFGGPKFFFIENNYINGNNTYAGGSDITVGGKLVWRYNILRGTPSMGDHSTARTFNDGRGGRAMEIYENTWYWGPSDYAGVDGTGGSTCLYYNNKFNEHKPDGIHLATYRLIYSYGAPFFGANGLNNWDYNATESNGSHVDGHAPYVFAQGTFSSGTGGDSLVDSSKTWTTNQWAGYCVKNSGGATALILSNTSNTLSVTQWKSQGFAAGQAYQIGKVLRSLDQVGLGAGAAINRNSPAWPNQASEPSYSWNNVFVPTGAKVKWVKNPSAVTIIEGRDYFDETPMPGYKPYVYPHPLVSGGATPAPTTPPVISPTPTPTAIPAATATATATTTATATVAPTPTASVTPTPTVIPSPTETPAVIILQPGQSVYITVPTPKP